MKRTRASALVIINWRGVFYERYLLDPSVTALEGANGSGKTTVLIAAYLILLPDMTRLRFTSLAEHAGGGGDKGIWGRLGQPGRPAYAVMELRLPTEERLLAGVHLERRTEPMIESTAFLITGLPDNIALQDVLLDRGDVDSVPELSQLRSQVARLGARLHTYSTVKEYFAALFDYGVTPLRLATDEERSKLNEMLRTSMMGGISRALTTDLREFLLKQETGLADTLKRMRTNLEACRRTRTEVVESQKLEHEISAVYEAGLEMFAAAVHATRERAQELQARVSDARNAVISAETNLTELNEQYSVAKGDLYRLTAKLSDLGTTLETDRKLLDRLEQARTILKRIRDRETSLAQSKGILEQAVSLRQTAEHKRDFALKRRDAARLAWERGTEGLADFTRGLEELERRAAEHQLVSERFAHAQTLRTDLTSDPECLLQAAQDAEAMRAEVNSQFIALDRTLSTATEKRREYLQVLTALQALHDAPVQPDQSFELARATLVRLRNLEAQVKQGQGLPAEIDRACELAKRQENARTLAARLESETKHLRSHQEVTCALDARDAKLQALEIEHREEDGSLENAEHLLEAQLQKIAGLETALVKWRTVEHKIATLEEWNTAIRTYNDVLDLRKQILELRDSERICHKESETKHAALCAKARTLEQTGGNFAASLLKIRDAVGGELLAGRFEEIDPDQAGSIEAILGPLAEAIVVDDPSAAVSRILRAGEKPDSVWLVGGDATLGLDDRDRPVGEVVDGSVVVRTESSGWRVTCIPDQPTLGRRARERCVLQLREQAAGAALEVDQHHTRLRQLEAFLDTTDQLLTDADILGKGDPSSDLELLRQTALETARVVDHHRESREKLVFEIEMERNVYKELLDLVSVAWLLDEPDYAARATALQLEMETVRKANRHLEERRPHWGLVEERLDILRLPPPSDEQLAELDIRRSDLEKRQVLLTELLMSFRYVSEHRAALDWTDAEASLHESRALTPALKQQLEVAKVSAASSEQELRKADTGLQAAIQAVTDKGGRVTSLVEAIELDRQEWFKLEIEDASDSVVAITESRISEAEREVENLEQEHREISRQFNQLELLLSQAKEKLDFAQKHLTEEEKVWKPEQERWQRLQVSAKEHGILAATFTVRFTDALTGQGSPNLRQKARERATALKERLAHARDVEHVQKVVDELLGPQELSGEIYLQAWLEVRNWLRRRVPTQIAQVDDPLEALGRLKEHLRALGTRLHQQETELRGESEDIARNIDIHIRRAQREMNRLNFDLEKVQFGSIQGVRLHLQRVERMDQVLSALREGQAQDLLFTPDMPIEEALEEIFVRFAGGRTGGQKLLDYREYLDPKIAVRRKGAGEWEVVNAIRLSTGEGIGIGAAVMMVILAAWERDANLLRPRRSHGTLRLLFLDEANRLDKENLGVLFDLCQNLELQLIVAAPEVARAEGNTTYRLVRRLDTSGREEVIVTGRRTVVTRATA